MRLASIILTFLIVASSPRTISPARTPGPGIELTCVGHEGFLLRGGREAVLLDAFLGPGESERDPLIRHSLDLMMAGRPPFERVTVALVSHPHEDHFDPGVAGRFLEQHPRALFAATPEVLTALQSGFARFPAIRRQLVEVRWGAGRRVSKVFKEVRIDFIKFGHEASQFYPEDVALHIVHIHGVTVLHGADPEMLGERLASLHLERQALDVAILPYSFLATPGADRVFTRHVRAKRIVAMHLPAGDLEQAKAAVRRQFPRAIFLVAPLQSIRL